MPPNGQDPHNGRERRDHEKPTPHAPSQGSSPAPVEPERPLSESDFTTTATSFVNSKIPIRGNRELELISLSPRQLETDTAILAVHGSWGCAEQFLPFMQVISDKGIVSHAVSMEGCGKSSGSEEDNIKYGVKCFLGNLVKTINNLQEKGFEKVVLVGHSLGGYLVQKLLATHQMDNIIGAVSAAGVPAGGAGGVNWRFFRKHTRAAIKLTFTLNMTELGQNSAISVPLLFGETPSTYTPNPPLGNASQIANVLSCKPITRKQREQIQQSPILVIGAEEDNVFTRAEYEKCARLYRQELTLLKGPHMGITMPEHTQDYAEKVAEFTLGLT